MLSAQWPIFCRIGLQLRQKMRVNIRFSNELFQRTLSDLFFIADQKSNFPWYFYGSNISFSAHVPIFMILMDWNFLSQTNYRMKRLDFFIRLTVGAHDPIFAPIFVHDEKSDRVRWT